MSPPKILYESREECNLKDQDVYPIEEKSMSDHFSMEIDSEENKSAEKMNDLTVLNRPGSLEPRVNEFLQAPCYGDDQVFYRYGIIDFLQAYTRKKKLETIALRKYFNKKPPNCFSCVEPNIYGDRFYEFMVKNLFT